MKSMQEPTRFLFQLKKRLVFLDNVARRELIPMCIRVRKSQRFKLNILGIYSRIQRRTPLPFNMQLLLEVVPDEVECNPDVQILFVVIHTHPNELGVMVLEKVAAFIVGHEPAVNESGRGIVNASAGFEASWERFHRFDIIDGSLDTVL